MESRGKIKRKLLVEQGFQLRYAFVFALTSLILGLLATGGIIAFSQSYYGHLEKAGAFLTPTLAEIYHQGWVRLCIILSVFTILYSLVVFYVGLILTRNIVGPMVAFKQSILQLLKGKKREDFELRSYDELKILKEIYTEIADHLQK